MSLATTSRRNVQRAPTRSIDKLSQIRSASSKLLMDKGATSKSVGARQQQSIAGSQQKMSVEPLQRVTKPGKTPIPIRHTLTSKLRMEKANPLLTSKFVSGIDEPSLSCGMDVPSRRSTFYPGMLQTKQKPDFRSIGPVSESRLASKKTVNSNKKNIGSLFKENKPPLARTKGNMLNIASRSVTSKPTQLCADDKSLPSSFHKKNISLSIQNKSSLTVQARSVQTSNKTGTVPVCNLSKTKTVTNTSVKPRTKNGYKAGALESRKPVMKTSVDSCVGNSRPIKRDHTPAKKQLKSILRKSASACDLRNIPAKESAVLSEIENQPSLAAKSLNKSLKSVAFYSPLHNSTFSPVNITNTPTPAVLRKRLEDWLEKRGKSSFCYRHLCCFGLPKNATVIPLRIGQSGREPPLTKTATPKVNQNGEVPRLNETVTLESSDSTAILIQSFEKEKEADIENSTPNGSSTPQQEIVHAEEDKENLASLAHPEALSDLRKLVYSGYPRDQCEHWLSLISKSHPAVKELPQYWECLAALEEARGDFSSAVDCYGRAIVKGADAKIVDEHLDELWEKFSTLSISAVENKRTPVKKLAVDTKQIFKSTVIKFALQQKAVKKSSKNTGVSMQNVNYIVTPVRRSSRRSQSLFRTTPTVKCVNSLEDLEQNIRETMEFHGNAVLNPGN